MYELQSIYFNHWVTRYLVLVSFYGY